MKTATTPEGPLQLRWSAVTDRGHFRTNNEDSFLALTFDARNVHYLGKTGEGSLGEMDYVFAVSDGMGGAKAGEFASRIAVEKITKLLPKGFKNRAAGLEAGFDDLLQEVFLETHKALSYLGANYEECSGMGSTLSLCWFTPSWMYFGHIGDSRIYYLPVESGLKQISHDGTHVGWLLRNGKINEREARSHPGRNSLQKALGAGHQFVDPQTGAVSCQKGDLFLLCSDGLTDGLWDKNLLELLRKPPQELSALLPANRLTSESLTRSGRDNTTALVVEIL